jgi:hypothetical protein
MRPAAEWETFGRVERRGRETRAERGRLTFNGTSFLSFSFFVEMVGPVSPAIG